MRRRFSGCPIADRICFTAMVADSCSEGAAAAWYSGPWRPTTGLRPMSALLPGLVVDLVQLDAALPRDLPGAHQLAQAVHRGAHHVVRVGRAQALGEDVRDAGAL